MSPDSRPLTFPFLLGLYLSDALSQSQCLEIHLSLWSLLIVWMVKKVLSPNPFSLVNERSFLRLCKHLPLRSCQRNCYLGQKTEISPAHPVALRSLSCGALGWTGQSSASALGSTPEQ